ncbi:MAG: hypothetical protein HFP77_08760 [Methylococcales symbiont of Iophon sp. n. MRB-2018]|nr:MAG: hypothetical protein HFP77_08760 [Methylococcales symbiont of Iophon sp. n. MRB-2018]KAF3979356.1 MAG: hypothetical protein HFP76_07920 [Methylococcales symbiont of Iophon sp. n. MRB-2018]
MTEINTDDFLKTIQHAKDSNNQIEKATCQAIAIDGINGLACFLGFQDGEISKVDYCDIKNHKIQFIEASDLGKTIGDLLSDISREIVKAKQQENPTKDLEKRIRKARWKPIKMEFQLKFQGSINVIERLYRKNRINKDPTYQLLIVCTNNTDIRILDILRNDLKIFLEGMIRKGVGVCTTRTVCQELISAK